MRQSRFLLNLTHTGHTDRRTDISNYRVASLLIMILDNFNVHLLIIDCFFLFFVERRYSLICPQNLSVFKRYFGNINFSAAIQNKRLFLFGSRYSLQITYKHKVYHLFGMLIGQLFSKINKKYKMDRNSF